MIYVKAFHARQTGLVDFACGGDSNRTMAGAFCAILTDKKNFPTDR
jgi:hypothetical protein